MTTSTKTTIKTIPSFHAGSRDIVAAQAKTDKLTSRSLQAIKDAEDALKEIRSNAFNLFIDSCHVAGLDRTEAVCKAIQTEIKNAFVDEVAIGIFQQATIDNYSSGAMRAFYHAEPWTTRAFQAVDKGGIPALPWSKKSITTSKVKTGGKVQSTTRAELDKTICKMLTQARLMGLTEFAADILDLCLDGLDGFAEVQDAPL